MVQCLRHFWPEFNTWLDPLYDPRSPPLITYHKRFLVWWGVSLFLFKLVSRRQLDFDLDARGTCVLDNLNRLVQVSHFFQGMGNCEKSRPRCCGGVS